VGGGVWLGLFCKCFWGVGGGGGGFGGGACYSSENFPSVAWLRTWGWGLYLAGVVGGVFLWCTGGVYFEGPTT